MRLKIRDRRRGRTEWMALYLFAWTLSSLSAIGQELAPRAYWPGPVGTKVLSIGYSFTDGDTPFDPSLPIDAADVTTHALSLAYHQILDIAGRSAGLTVSMPAVQSTIRIAQASETREQEAAGFGDLQLRLGMNFIGAPAMTPEEFQQFRKTPPQRILGGSLRVQLPTGDYNSDRVANVGTSRWAIKPELGFIERLGNDSRWTLDSSLGGWIYGTNDNFLGRRKEQSPMFAGEVHLVNRISPGRWLSLDWNYYAGGQTTVEGVKKDNRQENSRIGLTFNFALKQHVFKVAYSDSLLVKKGGDYMTFLLGYSVLSN